MSSGDGLTVTRDEHVTWVRLDRPARRNALDAALRDDLVAAFHDLDADADTRVIVLTGTGDRAFCAGLDLVELHEGGADVPEELLMRGRGRNVFEAVLECGTPTVAALNGWALGAGCELALACDLRVAAEHARLGMPEAKRGMGANFGSQLLPRLLPRALAYEMLYTGESIDAERARSWGLVNRVVSSAELSTATAELAGTLAANAPLSLRRYKAMVGKGVDLPVSAALRLDVGPNPYTSEDRREGVAAFVEKRAPRWRGR